MSFEEIVHPRHDSHDSGWRSIKREPSEPLNETSDQRSRQMRRGEESIHKPKKARAMLRVQQVRVEKGVQLRVELRVIQIFLTDEVEEAREGEEGGSAAEVVGVCEEVHEEFGAGEPGLDGVDHHAEEGFALGLGEVVGVVEDCEPGVLGAFLVWVYRGEFFVGFVGFCVEG